MKKDKNMKLAGYILSEAIKRFDKYLEKNGLTIEAELERLEKNGQIIGTTSIKPLSHQTISINSR
jgi:hypothetical protein